MAEMCEEFMESYGRQCFDKTPQLMRVIPIEREIRRGMRPSIREGLFHHRERAVLHAHGLYLQEGAGASDRRCGKPMDICMGIARCRAYSTIQRWGVLSPKKTPTMS